MKKIIFLTVFSLFTFVSYGKNLQWSLKTSEKMNWNQAIDYCKNLNEDGFTDWRLPNIDELRTIIKNCSKTETGGECNVSEKNGRLSVGNWYPQGSCYCESRRHNGGYYSKLGDDDNVDLWSSSTISGYPNNAWYVGFYMGSVGDHYKSKSNDIYVRCVRKTYNKTKPAVDAQTAKTEAKKQPAQSVVQKSFGDSRTGHLEWSDRSSNEMNWNAAKQYCKKLSEGGYSDWRLPNIDELRTVIKNCPATEIGGECKVSNQNRRLSEGDWYPQGSCYCEERSNNSGYYSKLGDDDKVWLWSSSTRSDDTDFAWPVIFESGAVSYRYKSFDYYVRCVRGSFANEKPQAEPKKAEPKKEEPEPAKKKATMSDEEAKKLYMEAKGIEDSDPEEAKKLLQKIIDSVDLESKYYKKTKVLLEKLQKVDSASVSNVDSAGISKVIIVSRAAIKKCYDKALTSNPTLKGKLSVKININEQGRVDSTEIVEDSLHDAEVATCVKDVIDGLRFPKPAGGSASVTFPFAFDPKNQ